MLEYIAPLLSRSTLGESVTFFSCIVVMLESCRLLKFRVSKATALSAIPIAASSRPRNRTHVTKSESGATMIEMTVVLPILLIFLLVSVDLLRLSFQGLSAQYIVSRALREAVIGPSARPSVYANQEDWIQGRIIELGSGLGLTVSAADIGICPFHNLTSGLPCTTSVKNAGVADELIAVQINAPTTSFIWGMNTLLGRNVYNIQALAVGRNETWTTS